MPAAWGGVEVDTWTGLTTDYCVRRGGKGGLVLLEVAVPSSLTGRPVSRKGTPMGVNTGRDPSRVPGLDTDVLAR
jgi:hypothetical protein